MTEFMNDWQNFVSRQALAADVVAASAGFFAPLTDFGLIAVSGDDAAAFLHSQLTSDVLQLPADAARLAGYCTAKGRLLATMLVWRMGDEIMLLLPGELLPATLKRLQMFVLRAKAKLRDASAECAIVALAGPYANPALAAHLPQINHTPYGKTESENGCLISLPQATSIERALWVAPIAQAIAAWPALQGALRPASASSWRLTEIEAGIPWVTLATLEQFVPQMINFELVGGVNFKKGCYPGQEIVARSQYLGKLKRRMLRAKVDATALQAGTEVFSAADPEQACGMIVNAQKSADGKFDCLVEIKTALAEQGPVHLGSTNGAALQFGSLPYALTGTGE